MRPFERPQKIALQHAHETREDDQIHAGLAQGADVGVLRLFIQFGAEFSRAR